MKKRKDFAFGKDIFLLGADKQGQKYWLEAPKWDCNWYWGFGYIESYTNNNEPSIARDISEHTHANKFMSEWFTEWNDSEPRLAEKTFSEKEGWELSELFSQFYHLREQAEFWGRGKMNVSSTKIKSWENKQLVTKINEKMIPEVTKRILTILTPKS